MQTLSAAADSAGKAGGGGGEIRGPANPSCSLQNSRQKRMSTVSPLFHIEHRTLGGESESEEEENTMETVKDGLVWSLRENGESVIQHADGDVNEGQYGDCVTRKHSAFELNEPEETFK